MNNITSIKDDRVVEARSLHSSAGRLAAQKFLLEGVEQSLWAIDSPCQIQHVFAHDKDKDLPCFELMRKKHIPIFFVTDGILKKITDTSYLVPIVGVALFPPRIPDRMSDFAVVLDEVNDFGNIGTIIRTAAAFGIHGFVSTKDTQDLFYKKTIDASRGTVFVAHLRRFSTGAEAIHHLKKQGYQIAVTTLQDSVMQSFAKIEPKPIAIVFGNETKGVSSEIADLADIKIQIPMSKAIESLNVGVAAGISIYEMKIKWTLAMLTKKIQESLGNHLFCASRWGRLVFDAKLKETTPFSADQAIMMMILQCDEVSNAEKLSHDAGLSPLTDIQSELRPLIDQGFVLYKGNHLSLSEQGKDAIAKIWFIHELSEQLMFHNISDEEKQKFAQTIDKICQNCQQIVPFS